MLYRHILFSILPAVGPQETAVRGLQPHWHGVELQTSIRCRTLPGKGIMDNIAGRGVQGEASGRGPWPEPHPTAVKDLRARWEKRIRPDGKAHKTTP